MNSHFGSDESATSASTTSSSSQSQGHPTPTTEPSSGAIFYDAIPSPRDTFGNSQKANGAVKVVSADADIDAEDSFVDLGKEGDEDGYDSAGFGREGDEDEEGTWDTLRGNAVAAAIVNHSTMTQPTIIVSDELSHSFPEPPAVVISSETSFSHPPTPLTPIHRYPGWLSVVVEPLSSFIDEAIEPRDCYIDLQEIAEGESGSIFAARVVPSCANNLRLPEHIRTRDVEEFKKCQPVLVAIKIITTAPHSSDEERTPEAQKLIDLERELTLMKGLWHENILGLDALYVDLTEDTLWVRMELMERSLADIVGLVVDGLMLQDRMIARFSRDVSV
jgi:p21-activated kinase 1